MKKLLYVLTGLCLLAGAFTACEKPEKESEKAKSTIEGVITDRETGEPLSGVMLTLQPGDKQVQTAEDGAYIFENLKTGTYTLKAQKDGYDDYENAEIQLGVEQTLTLNIEIGESICAIEGKVTDKKTGSPLVEVTLELQPVGKQVQTAQDGTYRFDSLKVRKYTLKAQKEGYVDYTKEEIQLVTEQVTTLDIEMEEKEEPFVEFHITDAEGKAIETLECDAPECSFKLVNVGNIAGGWSIESDADWITELSPKSGNLEAGMSETITLKRKLHEEDKGTVITIKTDKGDLSLKVINKGFVLEMVYVEGGEFEMGATEEQGEDARDNEKPVHKVTLDGFYIGKYEVTQAQWKAVMGNGNYHWLYNNFPVDEVSWEEAQEFCRKLSEATGRKYGLPTEAQWEYAARGGNKSQHYKYAGSNDINEVAWYDYNKKRPVGTKKANELGIYDMSGNVYEWCSDWYGTYDENDTDNPQGPASGSSRVWRGGGWHSDAMSCRVSARTYGTPESFRYDYGFRVACSAE